jgi:hypothetical protein
VHNRQLRKSIDKAGQMLIDQNPDDITQYINKPQEIDEKMADVAKRLYEQFQFNLNSQNFRERKVLVNFETMERVAEGIPLIQSIITKRVQQMTPFFKTAADTTTRGFVIKRENGKPLKDNEEREVRRFLMQTGTVDDPDREDDLSDAAQFIIRDILTFDQCAIELQRKKRNLHAKAGDVVAWWVLDGRTVKRIDFASPAYEKGYRYVQCDERTKPVAIFRPHELIFDYMNKRAGLRQRGYGYSYIEQALELVTTFLYGMTYNRDLFQKEKIPKGYLSVMGDVDTKTLTALKQHWMGAMSGYGAKFNIPILPSGKDGVGVEFKSLGQTNRDMEYHKLLMFITSLICAVYGIDPAELAIKTDDSQALIGESGEPRLQHSKDSGLGGLLAFLEVTLNKLLRFYNPDYKLEFTGIQNDDRKLRGEINRVRVETYMTINEVRESEGLEPINEGWANVVLNPQAVQLKGQEAMGGGAGAAGGEGGEDGSDIGSADSGADNSGGDGDGEDSGAFDWSATAAEAKPEDGGDMPSDAGAGDGEEGGDEKAGRTYRVSADDAEPEDAAGSKGADDEDDEESSSKKSKSMKKSRVLLSV